jgi:hypothetical protein
VKGPKGIVYAEQLEIIVLPPCSAVQQLCPDISRGRMTVDQAGVCDGIVPWRTPAGNKEKKNKRQHISHNLTITTTDT